MRIFLIIIFIVNESILNTQFTDRFWAFGDSAAIDFSNLSNPIPATSVLRSRGTCASISDSLGNLLFYASSPLVSLWLTPGSDRLGFVVNKNNIEMEKEIV
ncbi:MAG: hypothetical protein IPJ26_04290 [Bacteroidetes bacterium]|nr:hypothetical protein [Bacteroidota bacterium]